MGPAETAQMRTLSPLRALIGRWTYWKGYPLKETELGVTRATVTRRIQSLSEKGVILGFTVRVAGQAEESRVRAICHLAIKGPSMEETIRELRGLPEITGLHATNGEWDLIAEISVPSLAEVDVTLSMIRGIPGIYHSETSLLLRSVLA